MAYYLLQARSLSISSECVCLILTSQFKDESTLPRFITNNMHNEEVALQDID